MPDAESSTVPDEAAQTAQALARVTLPKVGGGSLRLGDLRGRKVLLFCWASW